MSSTATIWRVELQIESGERDDELVIAIQRLVEERGSEVTDLQAGHVNEYGEWI
jgi:hypothetical protein